jgi:hypothetical protein
MQRLSVGQMTASIYGTVLTLALITAYTAEEDLDLLLVAAAVVVTVGVFWLAHAHADLLARRYFAGRPLTRAEIVEQLREAFPMVQASLPPMLGLVAGGAGLLDDDTAVYLALGIGVAELAGWGIATGRKDQLGPLRTGALITLNVGLGLIMVGLKIVIH